MVDLVTGGAGFIGRHLVEHLVAVGRKVRILDMASDAGFPATVDYVRGSVTDSATVARAMAGVRRVFHLAANPELWAADPAEFERVNFGGTRVVLAAASHAGVERFVLTSSAAAYVPRHPVDGLDRLDETVELPPAATIGAYAASKRRAEIEVLTAVRGGALEAIVVSPTMLLGPGDVRMTPPTRMVRNFLTGRTPAFLDYTFNVIDVRDAALGHMLAAEHGCAGERYILGGHNVSMRVFLDLLGKVSSRRMPKFALPYPIALVVAMVSETLANHVTRRPPVAPLAGIRLAQRGLPFDTGKVRRELGLKPRPLHDTLADVTTWLSSGRPNQLPGLFSSPGVNRADILD